MRWAESANLPHVEPARNDDESAGDAAIAQALAAGDPAGLERAYRRYADRLHAYCRSVLHDAEAAADAVHDTFMVASQRAGELRDPNRLRAWLYAVARNECLRALRARRRRAPLDEAEAVSAESIDLGAGLRAEELRELVHTASAALPDNDREAIELALRHNLSAADVGAVLGVSANHAHARLSRARTQLERSLGALLVARTGADDCDELQSLLAGWDGRLTSLLRKRLARHIPSCVVCAERQRRQLQPSALLSGYATLPFALVSEELWTRLRLTCGSGGAGLDDGAARRGDGSPGQSARGAGLNDGQAIAARAGRFSHATGFPEPLDRRRRGVAWRAAAAAALVLLIIGGLALLGPRLGVTDAVWHPPSAASSPDADVTDPASEAPSPSVGTVSPPGEPSLAASSSPEDPGSPSPDASTATDLTVRATDRARCDEKTWALNVTAYVYGGEPDTVTLHWRIESGDERTAPMRSDGKSWQGTTETTLKKQTIEWWVSATTDDGGSGQTRRQTVTAATCPPPR